MSTVSTPLSDTRKKQSKKDEAIRKKIESELARKRTISTTGVPSRQKRPAKPTAQKGTVAALRPSPALTVPENITVSEASQLCAAKRTDCVLVVDDEEGLSGIFTAKDLAYRVAAEGLDPHITHVSQIMTKNPMVTRDTTSATEALQLMVERHFRHLPVCNEDGNVVGLLDITKVFHEAVDKVERSSNASEKLYNALAGVQSELGGITSNPQTSAMLAYVEALREKTALPDLTTVMDSRTQPATVGPKATVREVAKLMKERRVTAVCVMESAPAGAANNLPRIAGIFTSKDVVLRVIAAGLDAGRCSVVRVMTPHPDVAPPSMTVHDALKKMHNGHYLNLPVVEADGRLVAIVDVLKLTYATLEQMNTMSQEAGDTSSEPGGPMWGRFFDSIGGGESESIISGQPTDMLSSKHGSMKGLSQLPQSPRSDLHPNDSASVVMEDDGSVLDVFTKGGPGSQAAFPSLLHVDDGTYVFKFRAPSGRTHRFQSRHDNYEHMREIVSTKLAIDPFFTNFVPEDETHPHPDPSDYQLAYTDADGDVVLITSDGDVSDAVKMARSKGEERVVLFIQGGKGWEDATAEKHEVKVAEAPAVTQIEVKTIEDAETPLPAPPPPPPAEDVFGVPRDMLLPASIGVLAISIVVVFTISRLTSSNHY